LRNVDSTSRHPGFKFGPDSSPEPVSPRA
jgi:hypothetical protein